MAGVFEFLTSVQGAGALKLIYGVAVFLALYSLSRFIKDYISGSLLTGATVIISILIALVTPSSMILTLIMAIIPFGLILLLTSFSSSWKKGSIERREEREAGPTYRGIESRLEAVKDEEAMEEADEKTVKKGGKGARAAKKAEKAAEAETELEEVTTELEETATALVADLQNTEEEIQANINERLQVDKVEEAEIIIIGDLKKKLRSLSNWGHIDAATIAYLQSYFQSLSSHLKKQVLNEEVSEEHHLKFVEHLQKSIEDLDSLSQFAKTETKKLEKKEKREKKAFVQELKELRRAIKDRYNKLKREKRKGSKANPALIAQLEQEIKMLEKNAAELQKIQGQIEKTNELLELEISQLKEVLGHIIQIAKNQKNQARTLKKRESSLKKRLKEIRKKQEQLQQSLDKFSDPNKMHSLVLAFSEHLNDYFEYYIRALQDDLSFEEKVKEILIQNLMVEQKILAFVKLLKSLEASEAALKEGVAAILNIVGTITTNDISVSLVAESRRLREHTKVLDDEARMEDALSALDEEIEQKTMLTTKNITELIDEDKRVIAANQALHQEQSAHLAQSMATVMEKKVGMDTRYMNTAVKFGEQLDKRNAQAGAAYQEAMRKTVYSSV